MLIDGFQRRITYLRMSVTDRCDLRCAYCMPRDITFLPRRDLLTLDELHRLALAFISRGVRAIRLTGGEPLVRRDAMDLVRLLGRQVGAGTSGHEGRTQPAGPGAVPVLASMHRAGCVVDLRQRC